MAGVGEGAANAARLDTSQAAETTAAKRILVPVAEGQSKL
jgi:hypothetical protein